MTEPGRRIVMLGSGGHARALQESLALAGRSLAGFLAPDAASALLDVEWLGTDDALQTLDPAEVDLVNGVGSTRAAGRREDVYRRARSGGFEFLTIVDPSAVVRPSAMVGAGSQVLAGAIVNTGAVVGEDCIINSGAIVEHDCLLAAHVHVSPGAVLGGGVHIGTRSHIGLGARVLQGVSIGSDCTIGAGSVVTRDVEDGMVAVGAPATARSAR